jgi:predicted DNA-binding WGR domain protein
MEIYLVFVDAAQNSNKFWSAKVEQENLTVEWGRVGYKSQQKVHSFGNFQQAVSKFHNLVAEKKMKGYRDSSEIKRAIQLLEILRPYVAERQFANSNYLETLNQYLKIVPTPLGMKIIPSLIYRHVGDVDHQLSLLKSLLATESVQGENTAESGNNRKVVSLKTISKNFWRHI